MNSGQSDNELQRSRSSHQKLKQEHEEKLSDYEENPDAYDNDGRLRNAPSQEIREKIIQGRIKELTRQINRQSTDLGSVEFSL